MIQQQNQFQINMKELIIGSFKEFNVYLDSKFIAFSEKLKKEQPLQIFDQKEFQKRLQIDIDCNFKARFH